MHNTQHECHDRHPRRLRLLRPGDARPRARPPGARARRARLRLARRPARDARSTRASNGSLPAFVTNDEALASGADARLLLPRARAGGGARAAGRRASSSTSRARTGSHDAVALSGVVRLRASAAGVARPTGATRSRSCFPPTGRLIANPGCYATAALLALAPLADAIDPAASSSTRSRASPARGATLKAIVARGSCSRTSRRTRSARHQHAPEIAQALGFPVCFVPHLLPVRRGLLATCYVAAPTADAARRCSRPRTPASPVVRVLPEGVAPELVARAGHRRAPRSASSPTARPARAIVDLRDRQPRQGRRRPGGAEREPRARPRPRRPGCGSRECWYERHRRARGSSPPASHAGIRRERARTSRSSARPCPPSARRCSRATACRPRRSSSRSEHLALAEPQAVVINSGVANAATGERGELDALATAAEAARLLDLDAEEVLVLSTGVIGARLPLDKLLAGPATPRSPALSADGGARRGRGDHDHRHAHEGGGGRARRLHRRRDGEGLRDDPSRPRDDARGRHDRLPARAGRGDRVPPPGGRARASTRSRSTASARRTTPSFLLANGASGIERTPATDAAFAAALGRGLRRPRAADRRRRRGRDRARRDRRSRGAVDDAPGEGDRARGSPPRRSSRPRSSATTPTGAACSRPPARRRATAATRDVDAGARDALLQRHDRARPAARRSASSRTSRRRAARSSSTSASATARASYLTTDLSYDYVRINADYRT